MRVSLSGAEGRSADPAVAILMTASMSSLEGTPGGGPVEQGIRSCEDMVEGGEESGWDGQQYKYTTRARTESGVESDMLVRRRKRRDYDV